MKPQREVNTTNGPTKTQDVYIMDEKKAKCQTDMIYTLCIYYLLYQKYYKDQIFKTIDFNIIASNHYI